MPAPVKIVRIPALKTVADFRDHIASLGIELPCDDEIVTGSASPLAQPLDQSPINGKRIGNRYAIQPMEGWDGTVTGGATDEVRRRWRRFGESGAKLIFGGEAMAVRTDGRANPNQLIISKTNQRDLAELRQILCQAHQERFGRTDDLVLGFQLTHSGRFCKPDDKFRLAPRVAYRHPILDGKFGVTSDSQVFTDGEIEQLIGAYVQAAQVAREAGADFVDIKHCHGYLLHEFLGAHTRPGKYGGSFENRTRILREIIAGIRASGNPIEIAVRLSAFDFVPFKPDPALSQPGKPGPGIPEDFAHCLPYLYGFGLNPRNPVEPDLTEACQFAELCGRLGVKLLNLSAGSPYYNPHIQRPAAYPPSDGYQPPEDPLIGVARQIQAVRTVRAFLNKVGQASRLSPENVGQASRLSLENAGQASRLSPENSKQLSTHLPSAHAGADRQDACPTILPGTDRQDACPTIPPGADRQDACPTVVLIGSAYSYLQEYLPHVAQYVIRNGWTDVIGMGRMVLAYPALLADAIQTGALDRKLICRTFSDCTTAPRNGLISGCYPLDRYYAERLESRELKEAKKGS